MNLEVAALLGGLFVLYEPGGSSTVGGVVCVSVCVCFPLCVCGCVCVCVCVCVLCVDIAVLSAGYQHNDISIPPLCNNNSVGEFACLFVWVSISLSVYVCVFVFVCVCVCVCVSVSV